MKLNVLKKLRSWIGYVIYLVVVLAVFDVLVLHKLFGMGYRRNYQEEVIQRYPAPYVAFTGKPGVLDHNEFGFRGPSFAKADPGAFRIAFFGGSTGYNGDPPIPGIVERHLQETLGTGVFVANYSVVSSNHRQHLHGIIEFLPRSAPDLIVFYGGYNETLQNAYYDPRPGYPYNYYYQAETRPFIKVLLENSAIAGEIDKASGLFSGIGRLRNTQQPLSPDWNRRIADKYMETLGLANQLAGTIDSSRYGKSRFLAFYQPHQVPEEFESTHADIRKRVQGLDYGIDMSSTYDELGADPFTDVVHVTQEARELMGGEIAKVIAREIAGWRREGQ